MDGWVLNSLCSPSWTLPLRLFVLLLLWNLHSFCLLAQPCYGECNGNNHLFLRLDSAGGYGRWEEVHVPEEHARCRVPQCRQAQRHTERRERSCERVACKKKGQRMFPPLSSLLGVSLRPFYLRNYICILRNSKWLHYKSDFGFPLFF